MDYKKMYRCLTVAAMVVAVVMVFAGPAASIDYVSIGANPVGMAWYSMAAGMAEVINKNVSGVKASAEATKGAVQNLHLLRDKQLEIAFAVPSLAYEAYRGIGKFEGKKTPILGMFANQIAYQQIFALKASGIRTPSDFKGKRIGIGPPGSATNVDAKKWLEAHGIKKEEITIFQETLPEMTEKMKNGQLDATFWFGGIPLAPIVDLSTSRELTWISPNESAAKKLLAEVPFYFITGLPGRTYKGQKTTVRTIAYRHIIVARSDMSEKLIYDITKVTFENLDYLGTVHKGWKVTSLKSALDSMAIMPLHPGAVKYFKEVKISGLEEFLKRVSGR